MFLFHLQQFSVATNVEIFVDIANGLIVLQYISVSQSIFVGLTANGQLYFLYCQCSQSSFDKIY